MKAASVEFTMKELQAILAACGFTYENADGTEEFDATLDGIGEKIFAAFPELSEGCGKCERCRNDAANRASDPTLN